MIKIELYEFDIIDFLMDVVMMIFLGRENDDFAIQNMHM
jgi:hypothetical protein